MKILIFLFLMFNGSVINATETSAIKIKADEATDYLYRIDLVRATPGHLSQVINKVKVFQTDTNHWPYMLRHSQGDHWDLMLVWPVKSYNKLHDSTDTDNKYQTINLLYKQLGAQVNFQESTYMKGPDSQIFADYYNKNKLYHIEMFVALPDKKKALIKERIMESQYLININRKPNLLFVKEQGANWDSMTIGFYSSLKEFSSMADVPYEEDNKAAKDAGFESVSTIGFYLRSLLQRHNDSLAVKP